MGRSVDEHIREVAAAIRAAATRRARDEPVAVPARAARGGLLAAPAVATLDIPGFDNSQMDGFAVHASDLAAAGTTPAVLPTVAHVVAGGGPAEPLARGTVAPIMTGAPIPPGADAVVPVEHTSGGFGPVDGGGSVEFTAPVDRGTFVRPRASDLRVGDVVLDTGAAITPAAVGALVSAGVTDVRVAPSLRLAIVGTGNEVASGEVPDSNTAVLLAHAHDLGLTADSHLVPDDPAELKRVVIDLAATHDLIITTGGVSAGTREVVRQAFESTAGAWFGHVDVQPGGPQGLAYVQLDDRVVPIVCLPGNPVSVLVSFELFLRSPLAVSAGRVPGRPSGTAPLAAALQSPAGRTQVRRGRLDPDGRVELVGGPGSHLVAAYARADLLVFVPDTVTSLSVGDTVEWWRIA